MSIEMQIFYHTINTILSQFYNICQILLLNNIVNHKKNIGKTIFIYVSQTIISAVMTETAVPFLIRASISMIFFIMMYRFLLSEKVAVVALYMISFWYLCITLQEQIIILVSKIIHFIPWVDVGHGVQLGKARVLLISCVFVLVLTLLLKYLLKPVSEIMDNRDTWFLVVVGYILFCTNDALMLLFWRYVEGGLLFGGVFLILGCMVIGVALYVFFIKSLVWEKREREKRVQVEAMERQFAYYQDKQKDEEKVRSVYHDLKNHLLVLEHQIHSPETAEMVEELQQEVESYSDYVHTGNDFLDMIIKDKAGIAREKHIDFSAVIDMHGMDFIEPLDISTMFGNGLDNAIEASEKLPDGEGVIVVKVGRVQDFLSILMENNCLEKSISDRKHTGSKEGAADRKHGRRKDTAGRNVTSKKDKQLHGFGIPNMKNAAEKYGGQLTTQCEDGKFTLKILIPIP